MRVGAIGIKQGMMTLFNEWGAQFPVTVIRIKECQVVATKMSKKPKVQVAAIETNKVNLPGTGLFSKFGYSPKRHMREFVVDADKVPENGAMIVASQFVPGQMVDVVGKSIGKGFQGVMKRWGFKGQPATHGVSKTHRSPGSIGSMIGRVLPGKKMPGRMGNDRIVTRNLQVIKVDTQLGLLYVKGAVPGCKQGVIEVRDATKQPFDIPLKGLEAMIEGELPREVMMKSNGQDPFAAKNDK